MEKIDFVIAWVDGNDTAWLEEKSKYVPNAGVDNRESRYRDWDNLRYWFRGVETYAPWVNKIHFVTYGHVPEWLNLDHPKLHVVKHSDYMDKKYLPTFSSHPIELNFHRIEGLSEQFIYFNDDMFLINKVEEKDFFMNGLPRDCCVETAITMNDIYNPFAHILLNNIALINKNFQKKQVIKQNVSKWFHFSYGGMLIRNLLMIPYKEFAGFKYFHQPSPFLKSTFEKVWNVEGEYLDYVCTNKFRSVFDVNQYIFKYWQYMEGRFSPQNPNIGRFFSIGKDDSQIFKTIEKQEVQMICINDEDCTDFEMKKKQLIASFERILPKKSSYER